MVINVINKSIVGKGVIKVLFIFKICEWYLRKCDRFEKIVLKVWKSNYFGRVRE